MIGSVPVQTVGVEAVGASVLEWVGAKVAGNSADAPIGASSYEGDGALTPRAVA